MEQDFPFRPRGKHGFDRDDVINYISQAQQRCNEHLAHLEELEQARQAWFQQAKTLEREKATLVAKNRELEERLSRQPLIGAADTDECAGQAVELAALQSHCAALQEQLQTERERRMRVEALRDGVLDPFEAPAVFVAQDRTAEIDALNARLAQAQEDAQQALDKVTEVEHENIALVNQLRALSETYQSQTEDELLRAQGELASLTGRLQVLEAQSTAQLEQIAVLERGKTILLGEKTALQEQVQQQQAKQREQDATIQEITAQIVAFGSSIQERDILQQKLAEQETAAHREVAALQGEANLLRERVSQLEQKLSEQSVESAKTSVAKSKAVAEVLLQTSLRDSQHIDEITSQHISRVSDATASLVEQLSTLTRTFGDMTDSIRHDLASFQRGLTKAQRGTGKKDTLADSLRSLVDEHNRFVSQITDQVIVAELAADEDLPAPLLSMPPQSPPGLAYAEELEGKIADDLLNVSEPEM
ncbi:MAG: hypothetical protein LBB67_03040 [Oscillospiraceae bacterium]|jgi:DNA repair exonuclease SbcCD ATPase subunit|nr:hypothetical protein [Oscillospiraceae bacterium]